MSESKIMRTAVAQTYSTLEQSTVCCNAMCVYAYSRVILYNQISVFQHLNDQAVKREIHISVLKLE